MQIAAIGSLVLGAIGTGISYFGQREAAKTQSTFALLNAQSGKAQSEMQSRMAVAQAALQTTQAKNQQAQGASNAAALRSEADMRERAGRINAARQEADNLRIQSMLRARAGKSGTVADTASPLDTLTYSAELEHAQNVEDAYQNELQVLSLRRQGLAEELGADRAGIQGELDWLSGSAQASAYRAQGVQAQLAGIAGVQGARGTSIASLGGALGNFGQMGLNAYQMYRQGAFRFGSAA